MTEAELTKLKEGDLVFYIKNGKMGMRNIEKKEYTTPDYPGMKCVLLEGDLAVPYQFAYRYVYEANFALQALWCQDESAGKGTATDEADYYGAFECSNCGCECDYTRSCGVDLFNFCPVCGYKITKHMSEVEE